ncbi:hypothetical protein HK102_005021, partial [Quaeritorhiza haematococci]
AQPRPLDRLETCDALGGIDVVVGWDMPQFDVAVIENQPNACECAKRCEEEIRCRFFSFTETTLQCFLKSSDPLFGENPFLTHWRFSEFPVPGDIPGFDLFFEQLPPSDNVVADIGTPCMAKCKENPDCVWINFNRLGGCWLKKPVQNDLVRLGFPRNKRCPAGCADCDAFGTCTPPQLAPDAVQNHLSKIKADVDVRQEFLDFINAWDLNKDGILSPEELQAMEQENAIGLPATAIQNHDVAGLTSHIDTLLTSAPKTCTDCTPDFNLALPGENSCSARAATDEEKLRVHLLCAHGHTMGAAVAVAKRNPTSSLAKLVDAFLRPRQFGEIAIPVSLLVSWVVSRIAVGKLKKPSAPPVVKPISPRCNTDADCGDGTTCVSNLCTNNGNLAPAADLDIASDPEVLSKALIYSHMAAAAYDPPQTLTVASCGKSYTLINKGSSPNFDLKCAIYVDEKYTENRAGEIVIAFKGSETLQEWAIDLDSGLTDCLLPGGGACGKIHSGFLNGWADLRNLISEEVMRLLALAAGPVNLALTGHSLGGALARLAAVDLNFRTIKFNDVYTFGAPRIGDAQFEAAYNAAKAPGQSHARIVQWDKDISQDVDPVTVVPFVKSGYADPQQPRYLVPCLNDQNGQCFIATLHDMESYKKNIIKSSTNSDQLMCSTLQAGTTAGKRLTGPTVDADLIAEGFTLVGTICERPPVGRRFAARSGRLERRACGDADLTFIGLHGTSVAGAAALKAGNIQPGTSQQLGAGLYVTDDEPTARFFARNRKIKEEDDARKNGDSNFVTQGVVLRVFARNFNNMVGLTFPPGMDPVLRQAEKDQLDADFDWIAADHKHIDPDVLELRKTKQIKFCPRALASLAFRDH